MTHFRIAVCFAALLGPAAVARAQTPPRLSLSDAEQRALAGHPSVRAAQSAAQVAQQSVREVRSAYWPTIFGSVTGAAAPDGTRIAAGALNNPSILDRFATGVTATQLVTDFGRTRDLVQTQTLRASAQEQDAVLIRAQVRLDVDRAYFETLRAQAVLRVAQQTVAARQLVVDQVGALASSGLKSGLDLSFARVNLSQARLLLVQAEGDVQAAFAALNAAMGSAQQATFELVEEPISVLAADDAAALIAVALRDRPDVVAERFADQAASRFVDAERALSRPTMAAVGVAGVTPYRDTTLNDHYSAAGFNVTVPLLNGGLYSARRAEASYRAQIADDALRDLENRVARDVTIAWLRSMTARQRMDLTNELLAQASDALELAQSRYNLGLSSIVELTQAQLNETEAEIGQAAARYDYQLRGAELRFQTGALK